MILQDKDSVIWEGQVLRVIKKRDLVTSPTGKKRCAVIVKGVDRYEVHVWITHPKHFKDVGDHTHVWKSPSAEEFGKYGWCYTRNDMGDQLSFDRFNSLI